MDERLVEEHWLALGDAFVGEIESGELDPTE